MEFSFPPHACFVVELVEHLNTFKCLVNVESGSGMVSWSSVSFRGAGIFSPTTFGVCYLMGAGS
jgi:hypothetical protein